MSNNSSMTAYGHTWPMIRTPMINVRIDLNLLIDRSDGSVAKQIKAIEAEWKAVLPEEAEVEVKEVDSYDLSPKDRAEHERLAADEAIKRMA